MIWKNRQAAGRELAEILLHYKKRSDMIVLGLARGGVIVAFEVARILELPLDVIVTRKISAPHNLDLGIGVVDEDGNGVFFDEIIQYLHISKSYLKQAVADKKLEIEERLDFYRNGKAPLDLHGKDVLLVDDGIATGSTMLSAIQSVRHKGAKHILVATPVVTAPINEILLSEVDEVSALYIPAFLRAVGQFYENFAEVSLEEIKELLSKL